MLEHMVLSTGKHGRVARGVALASDMTMREGRRCQRVGVVANFFFFFFHNSHRCGANSSQFTPTRAVSGETSRFKSKFKKKKKTFLSVRSYLYLNSHLQLSLTLWSLCSTPRLSGLCSLSPLSHTISLLTHSHTHIISLSRVSTLNSLTLCSPSPFRYQSQAFNLSFS